MGLLTLPFRLPLMPVQGVIRLAEMLRDQAEQEHRAALQRQLEEVAEAEASGRISPEEAYRIEQEILDLLTGRPVATPAGSRGGEEG